MSRLTLVALLLALSSDGQILALLPFDVMTLSVIIDEVATVAALGLVEVGLGDDLVLKELIFGKLKDETESGSVKVLHTKIGQVLQGTLISIGDHLGKRDLVLHGR